MIVFQRTQLYLFNNQYLIMLARLTNKISNRLFRTGFCTSKQQFLRAAREQDDLNYQIFQFGMFEDFNSGIFEKLDLLNREHKYFILNQMSRIKKTKATLPRNLHKFLLDWIEDIAHCGLTQVVVIICALSNTRTLVKACFGSKFFEKSAQRTKIINHLNRLLEKDYSVRMTDLIQLYYSMGLFQNSEIIIKIEEAIAKFKSPITVATEQVYLLYEDLTFKKMPLKPEFNDVLYFLLWTKAGRVHLDAQIMQCVNLLVSELVSNDSKKLQFKYLAYVKLLTVFAQLDPRITMLTNILAKLKLMNTQPILPLIRKKQILPRFIQFFLFLKSHFISPELQQLVHQFLLEILQYSAFIPESTIADIYELAPALCRKYTFDDQKLILVDSCSFTHVLNNTNLNAAYKALLQPKKTKNPFHENKSWLSSEDTQNKNQSLASYAYYFYSDQKVLELTIDSKSSQAELFNELRQINFHNRNVSRIRAALRHHLLANNLVQVDNYDKLLLYVYQICEDFSHIDAFIPLIKPQFNEANVYFSARLRNQLLKHLYMVFHLGTPEQQLRTLNFITYQKFTVVDETNISLLSSYDLRADLETPQDFILRCVYYRRLSFSYTSDQLDRMLQTRYLLTLDRDVVAQIYKLYAQSYRLEQFTKLIVDTPLYPEYFPTMTTYTTQQLLAMSLEQERLVAEQYVIGKVEHHHYIQLLLDKHLSRIDFYKLLLIAKFDTSLHLLITKMDQAAYLQTLKLRELQFSLANLRDQSTLVEAMRLRRNQLIWNLSFTNKLALMDRLPIDQHTDFQYMSMEQLTTYIQALKLHNITLTTTTLNRVRHILKRNSSLYKLELLVEMYLCSENSVKKEVLAEINECLKNKIPKELTLAVSLLKELQGSKLHYVPTTTHWFKKTHQSSEFKFKTLVIHVHNPAQLVLVCDTKLQRFEEDLLKRIIPNFKLQFQSQPKDITFVSTDMEDMVEMDFYYRDLAGIS